jgi:hypothetical protein
MGFADRFTIVAFWGVEFQFGARSNNRSGCPRDPNDVVLAVSFRAFRAGRVEEIYFVTFESGFFCYLLHFLMPVLRFYMGPQRPSSRSFQLSSSLLLLAQAQISRRGVQPSTGNIPAKDNVVVCVICTCGFNILLNPFKHFAHIDRDVQNRVRHRTHEALVLEMQLGPVSTVRIE